MTWFRDVFSGFDNLMIEVCDFFQLAAVQKTVSDCEKALKLVSDLFAERCLQ